MIRTRWLAAGFVTLLATCPSAAAITPPLVDPSAVPANPAPGPSEMVQRGACVATGVMPGTAAGSPSESQKMLNLPAAWQFSRGDGQTVAVIDTGVRPGPRLPNVDPGGDYLQSSDGLTDCDGHGTAVAGIIAGQPGSDAFSGVAPAARLLSIRQTSAKFAPRVPGQDPEVARAKIDIGTLARAIVYAADRGARVINVSVVTCLPVATDVDQTALGAAIHYAAVDKDAVVVAAAGNVTAGVGCATNPLTDLSKPEDPRNWAGVSSLSIPSEWQPYVLSVGSLAPSGQPSGFTMSGPWVGIGAPGEGIVSLSNGDGGGLASGFPAGDGAMTAMNGTSYAAAYVSGVAALVRSRFPELTSAQVVDRLLRTAHSPARTPSNLVGAGAVDPVAALTWQMPSAPAEAPLVGRVAPPAAPPADAPGPLIIAFTGVGLLAAIVAAVALWARRKAQVK